MRKLRIRWRKKDGIARRGGRLGGRDPNRAIGGVLLLVSAAIAAACTGFSSIAERGNPDDGALPADSLRSRPSAKDLMAEPERPVREDVTVNTTQTEGRRRSVTSMNRVFLAGNLTRDPELRHTPGGTAVADIGLAINEKFTSKDGEAKESTCFADIVVWGRQAETCQEHLVKGSAVMVEGRLQYDQWETEDGQRRTKIRIRANRVQFIGRPRNGNGNDAEPGAAEPGESMPF